VGAFFATATVSTLGNMETTLFWTDNWIQGSSIRCLAPTVFTVVPRRRRSASVTEALNGRAWVHHTTGPRTMRLLTEFLNLWTIVEQVELTLGVPDTFCWRLSADGQYSTSSA
jgi:hypothetical protein